ncbi:Mut3p-like transcriptional activator [Fusarium heterosporum]|uniref:Mut3p-like transcriptional activator n=1 Tax=Fusarium heterosporum TaxID=42747 RepID=A0A8H5TTL9_FUSHE|nr:Mut3p-like transcriptional activator [Fusarium heterosporum]
MGDLLTPSPRYNVTGRGSLVIGASIRDRIVPLTVPEDAERSLNPCMLSDTVFRQVLLTYRRSKESLSQRLARLEEALAKAISHPKNAGKSTSKPLASTSLTTETTAALKVLEKGTTSSSAFLNAPPPSLPASNITSSSPDLFQKSPDLSNVPSPSSTLASPASYGQIQYLGCNFGSFSPLNGMPLLLEEGKQWIMERTGDELRFDPSPESSTVTGLHRINAGDLYELPERSIVERIFDVFVHSTLSLGFPVIDKVLFKDTIALAYESNTTELISLEAISAKVCVLAFASSIYRFNNALGGMPYIDADLYARRARYLLTDILEVVDITTIQASFMLSMYEVFSGRVRSGAVLHALACQIVLALGGHTRVSLKPWILPVSNSERKGRQLRMLFWLCYVFDKDIALRTGQPPLIVDAECDLTLPEGYLSCYSYMLKLDRNLSPTDFANESLTSHFPCDLQVSHIKDKTIRLLYSARAAKKTSSQLLQDIRELDEELEAWRQSLPPDFRPALSICDESQVSDGQILLPRNLRLVTLHLDYHHLMTAIHRASGECIDTDSDMTGWGPGVASSIALALEASRSTLAYWQAAMIGLAGEAFWIVAFYATAPMTGLFLNILLHPLDESTEKDLSLLKAVADVIYSLPLDRLKEHELAQMKLITEFAAELYRLGRSAAVKATWERDMEVGMQMNLD